MGSVQGLSQINSTNEKFCLDHIFTISWLLKIIFLSRGNANSLNIETFPDEQTKIIECQNISIHQQGCKFANIRAPFI